MAELRLAPAFPSRISTTRALLAQTSRGYPGPAQPAGRRWTSRHRRLSRNLGWVGVAVAVVAVVLLSEVPVAVWAALSTEPAATHATLPATKISPSGVGPQGASRATPASVNQKALCLLGVAPGCLPRSNSPSGPTRPSASDPVSSWTNITPPSGSSNPPPRFLSAMTYFPSGHDVVLFGGYGEVGSAPFAFYQDTWSFVNNRWTEVISNKSCTATTCPSPRAGAMLAYYAPDNALLLFGGYVYSASITYIPFNDTWLYANGAWTNITASAGPAPSPRFEASMVWDSYDNDVLLFGGSNASGNSSADTWTFNGTWHLRTLAVHPVARAGAAITGSPSGWIMMFGGEDNGIVILDPTCGASSVAWWFYNQAWHYMGEPTCVNLPAVAGPAVLPNATFPPCGRVNPALGWSPKNERFVLYGGYGPTSQNTSACTGFYDFLNDTWTYAPPPGNGFNWNPASDSGDPSNRTMMGYASDFTDNYFEIFGGWDGTDGGLNATWRFYEVVHAHLTGPSNIDTSGALTFAVPFTVTGYGGTGNLSYTLVTKGLKNGNLPIGSGCWNLTEGNVSTIPYDGVTQVLCKPLPTSFNVDRLTVTVVDDGNLSDFATANWTFTISPPETMAIYSQYVGYFYSGISFMNKFGIIAQVAGESANGLSASVGGVTVGFAKRTGTDWWDGSLNIDTVPVGNQVLQATATFPGNWTLNATYKVNVVDTPSWLISVIQFPEISQTVTPKGAGPYNETYSITEAFTWSLSQALGFNINLPFVSGNVSLVPGIKVSLTATSTGNISINGQLSLTPPSIDLGVAKIGISVAVGLKGTFTLGIESGEITGVQWQYAQAYITITGKFGASVPIYGFNVLGVKVGFTLEVEVDPSITLGAILAPTTPGFDEFIQGIQVKIESFIGSFSLPLSLAVNFGIGFASIGIGGSISVAVEFATSTGLYIPAGWINGTIFIEASFLCWSTQWNLASGTIYSWTNPPPTLPAFGEQPATTPPAYDNGTNATWTLHARYYLGPNYDQLVWSPPDSSGTAVSDIYPYTEVTGGAGANGAYVFYTNDNASLPVAQGLGVSGLDLSPSTNGLSRVPSPSDPGFEIAAPKAATLADGSLYVLWDALPASEEGLATPAALTSLELQGARFYPSNHTWGPVHTWTSWGLAQSYQVDATGPSPTVAALVSTTWLVGQSTPERLVEFNLTSGAELANSSVTGLSSLASLRGSLGEAVVQDVGGNYSLASFSSGSLSSIPNASPIGGALVSAEFARGSASTAVLLYRASNASLLALYDLASDRTVATLTLGQNAFEAEAVANGGTFYVFARTTTGVEAWQETGGGFTNLTSIPEPGVVSYALVQYGSGILVYSLLSSGGSTTPTVTLAFAEVGATLTPVGATAPSSPSSSSSGPSPNYLLYLAAAGAAVVVLLAVVAILARRRPPSGTGGPQTAHGTGAAAPPPGGEAPPPGETQP
jgi:Galactose oxidase, central domain